MYYPANPVLGEAIQVLVYINDYKHRVINWIHGDEGLFSRHIYKVMAYADVIKLRDLKIG